MKKHYIDQNLKYIGYHGAAPKNSIELPQSLVGKSVKIITEVDEMGSEHQVVVLDEVLDAQRISDESAAATAKLWSDMRTKRDQLLKDTDHTQLVDAPIDANKKSEYVTYRAALRNLPSVISDITNFNYPVKPE